MTLLPQLLSAARRVCFGVRPTKAVNSASNVGSDALRWRLDDLGSMTRAWSRSSFPRPYIWRLTSLSLQI
jgi:hypothetical protein